MIDVATKNIDKSLLSEFIEAKTWAEKHIGLPRDPRLATRIRYLAKSLSHDFCTESDIRDAKEYIKRINEFRAQYETLSGTDGDKDNLN